MSETGTRRRRGREVRREARRVRKIVGTPYIHRRIPLTEVLSEEGLEIIEANAETILEEIGIEFTGDAEALDLWRDAGADVRGTRVHIPRGLARRLAATAPSEFVQHARNPEKSVVIGGPNTVFAPVYGPPFVRDLDNGRRYATIEDFQNFVKLTYMTPALHHSGGTLCEPVDLPVNKRHLEMVYSHIRYSDKPFMGSVTMPERAADSIAMARIVFGEDFLDGNAAIMGLVSANSPLVFDATMLGSLKVYARAGQAQIIGPFIISGAMSPASMAGTLAQAWAEGLAGIAFSQLVRAGAPVLFGLASTSMSMQSGAPTFGTPEPQLVLLGALQLARRLGVPFRSSGALCTSKVADAQAGFESMMSLLTSIYGGAHFVLHAAGWLEGGLCAGYEKFVLDMEHVGMMHTFVRGLGRLAVVAARGGQATQNVS